jgi:hypothetical protein
MIKLWWWRCLNEKDDKDEFGDNDGDNEGGDDDDDNEGDGDDDDDVQMQQHYSMQSLLSSHLLLSTQQWSQ